MEKPLRLAKLAGTVIDDDIELIELLGEGGMGLVYRAHQRSLNRSLCIKFLRSNLVADVEWLKRFRREASALSKVRESHIVSIYFVGLLADVYPYMAMEYVEGRSLRQIINAESSIDWRRCCRIFIQICEAISLVHSKGFIHRDLKPDNLILEGSEENELVKILDFGICGLSERHLGFSRLTLTSDMLGSVFYMAPECFRRAQSSPAVDIYSIGCMLFEALTGAPPFVADSPVALASEHNNSVLPRLPHTVANAAERAALDAIMKRACAKKPEERFANCSELAQCFKDMLEGKFSDVLDMCVCLPRMPAVGLNWTQLNSGAFNLSKSRTGAITLFVLCSLGLWFALADPSPVRIALDVVQRLHLPVPSGTYAQAGAFLEHLRKPGAAALLFIAASETQKAELPQVEMQLKATQCLALANDDMVAQSVADDGLVNIERLLQQSNSDTDTLARLANGFARYFHSKSGKWRSKRRLAICSQIIGLFQRRDAVSQRLPWAEIPELNLLPLRLHSDLDMLLGTAGESFINTMSSAVQRGDFEKQVMILQVVERSLNCFPDRKNWAKLCALLRDGKKERNLIAKAAIASLQTDLSDDVKFRLCAAAVQSHPTEADRAFLRGALSDFVLSSPIRLKPFESLQSALTAAEWPANGQLAKGLRHLLTTYLTCPATSPSMEHVRLQLRYGVEDYLRASQNSNSVQALDDVMKAVFAGDLALPTEFAEILGRSWLRWRGLGKSRGVDSRASAILKQDCLRTVDAVNKVNNQSLRALLLGISGEFATANQLFEAAEAECVKDSQTLAILHMRRAEVEVAQLDFAKAELTIEKARLIERLKDDPAQVSRAKYLLFASRFGQGIDLLNCKIFTGKAIQRKSGLFQVETQLKAVQYFTSVGDDMAARYVSEEGLVSIESLLHQGHCSETDALAHFANGFAKQLLLQDKKWGRSEFQLAQTCSHIVSQLQVCYINPEVVVSAIPDLFLLFLRLCSDLGNTLGSAGIVVADSMLLAARHGDFKRQVMILQVLDRSLGCFPDRKSWAQLINVLLRDRTAISKKRSLLVKMATTSLQTGLSDDEKFQLCAAAVESNPKGADRTLLRAALRNFVMSSPVRLKPFESFQSALNAAELRAKGQYEQALCQNIVAYEVCLAGSPTVVTPPIQPYCDLRLSQAVEQTEIHKLDDLMETILEADSPLSYNIRSAEILGGIWLKLHMDELGKLADSRAIAILKRQRVSPVLNARSLRALLLGLSGEFAMAARLFAAAETECPKDSLSLAILLSRRATVELAQLDFAKAERTIQEARLIEKSNAPFPPWLTGDLKNRLFVSLFGQGKIDFADCYANPQKYNCSHPVNLARAVHLAVKAMRVRRDLSKARNLLEAALVLADGNRVGFLPKLWLLDEASTVYADCGHKELARVCLGRCLEIAVQHHLAAVATDCRARLRALK